jgi:hypothetical protein
MRELANTAGMTDVKSRQAFFPFEIVCRHQPLEMRLESTPDFSHSEMRAARGPFFRRRFGRIVSLAILSSSSVAAFRGPNSYSRNGVCFATSRQANKIIEPEALHSHPDSPNTRRDATKRELPTKRLAERRLATILARINCLDYRPGRAATFGEFIERWKTEVLTTQKPSSARAVRSHLNCYIIPEVGQTTSGRIWRREPATIHNSDAREVHGEGCLPKDNLECHRNNLHDPRNSAELGLQLRTDRYEEAAPATARCRVRGAALYG